MNKLELTHSTETERTWEHGEVCVTAHQTGSDWDEPTEWHVQLFTEFDRVFAELDTVCELGDDVERVANGLLQEWLDNWHSDC